MSKTLYKRTHLVAVTIFATLLLAAGSAVGWMDESAPRIQARATETLGRFVVTPNAVRFQAPKETFVAIRGATR